MEGNPTKDFVKRYQHWILATLSAVLLFCSFPNANLFPLAWFALVPLFVALTRAKSWKSAFGIGYLTGFLFFAGMLLAILLLYPYANIAATLLGYLLLVGYTALYFAVFASLIRVLPWRAGVLFPIAAACIWTALEWVRSWMLTGFPWGSIGYSQWNNLSVIQIASIFGVHGVSFVIVLFNAGIATVIFNAFHTVSREKPVPRRAGFFKLLQKPATVVPLIVTLACFAYGILQLQSEEARVQSADANPNNLNVALVPGNIPQLQKWNRNEVPAILHRYITLTRQASTASPELPELIVWPETAVREKVVTGDWPTYHGRFRRLLQETGVPFLLGTTHRDESRKLFNSVFLLSPQVKELGQYDKMHLVPFGEYVPLRRFIPDFVPNFILFEPFEPGKKVNLLPLSNVKRRGVKRRGTENIDLGVAICFESVFPDHFRKFVQEGAQVMGILTNDAWFVGTAFPEQHFSMAPFRAVENRIAIFRCANGGISCIVDKFGRTITPLITPNTTEEVLVARVPLLTQDRQTLYTRYGDWFPIACAILCVGWFAWTIYERRKNKCS